MGFGCHLNLREQAIVTQSTDHCHCHVRRNCYWQYSLLITRQQCKLIYTFHEWIWRMPRERSLQTTTAWTVLNRHESDFCLCSELKTPEGSKLIGPSAWTKLLNVFHQNLQEVGGWRDHWNQLIPLAQNRAQRSDITEVTWVHTLMYFETPAVAKYSSSLSKAAAQTISPSPIKSPYFKVAFTCSKIIDRKFI